MMTVRTLLLIDNDAAHVDVFTDALLNATDGPFHGECVKTLAEGIRRSRGKEFWAIFLNLSLPDSQGVETFDKLALAVPGVPTLIIAGASEVGIALEGMRRGAKDYLLEGRLDRDSFVRAVRNMAERKTAEELLFREKERAQVTLDSIGDAVLSTDLEGKVVYLNVVAEKITGWTREEAAGKSIEEVFVIVDGGTREPCANPLRSAIQKNRTVGLTPNCILIRRDGAEFAIEDSAAPIHDQHGLATGAVIVFHDVSVARAMGAEMSHMAQHDTLTNLPNRTLLQDRLTQAIATASRNDSRIAVLFLDLDGFKNINDSLSHATGDRLLQLVAKRLLAAVRTSDTVCRMGGDEFVILLSEVAHAGDAGVKAGKILSALSAPFEMEQNTLRITGSIGLSTYPEDGRSAELLIRNADLAMYQAKEKGRSNYQFFEKGMNVRAVERQSIEGDLRFALERDELVMHYQPKVDLRTGGITGVEALLRWQHPERGLVGPLQFISIAEDCGLMLPIGQWVLRESCRQAKAWQDAGLPAIEMAVNVSSVEFRSDKFVEDISTILKETGLKPRYLELELTESVLMQHAEFSVPVLQKLKAMGVRLAIDDFGTGYSSLSYLRQFPIDTLKIDQSFTHEINADTDEATIISAVINMGCHLKHRVIAEGVETAEQLAFLRAHGCDEGQGYYFGRAMPALETSKLLDLGTAPTVFDEEIQESGFLRSASRQIVN
ncbi:MAG TPA: EAL domain-containing protein [Verrucomicrobiae bacterium]|nr:EAL domain-containing protein [Verrucomicrobiae bacterium]